MPETPAEASTWYLIEHFPPPERELALFYWFGRFGVGFYENGEFRQGYEKADWTPTMWQRLHAPNRWDGNYLPRNGFCEKCRMYSQIADKCDRCESVLVLSRTPSVSPQPDEECNHCTCWPNPTCNCVRPCAACRKKAAVSPSGDAIEAALRGVRTLELRDGTLCWCTGRSYDSITQGDSHEPQCERARQALNNSVSPSGDEEAIAREIVVKWLNRPNIKMFVRFTVDDWQTSELASSIAAALRSRQAQPVATRLTWDESARLEPHCGTGRRVMSEAELVALALRADLFPESLTPEEIQELALATMETFEVEVPAGDDSN